MELSQILFFQAHWNFSLRYWQVSEIIYRWKVQRSICTDCVLHSVNVVMTILISVNFIAAGIAFYYLKWQAVYVTMVLMPLVFMLIDSVVLIVAVVRVFCLLKGEEDLNFN